MCNPSIQSTHAPSPCQSAQEPPTSIGSGAADLRHSEWLATIAMLRTVGGCGGIRTSRWWMNSDQRNSSFSPAHRAFRRVVAVAAYVTRQVEWLSRSFAPHRAIALMVAERQPTKIRTVRPFGGPSLRARVGRGETDLRTLVSIWEGDRYCPVEVAAGSAIIDAGANVGYSAVWFATHFPSSRVIAVEPDDANVEILRSNVAHLANVSVVHGALSATSGESIIVDPGEGPWGYRTWQPPSTGAPVEISVRGSVRSFTVDELIDEFRLGRVGLAKIDIEGAELEVFRQSGRWIDSVDCVMVELHDRFRPGCSLAFDEATCTFDDHFTSGENSFALRTTGTTRRRT